VNIKTIMLYQHAGKKAVLRIDDNAPQNSDVKKGVKFIGANERYEISLFSALNNYSNC